MRQRPRSGRTRAAIVALALATAFAVAATPAHASVGSVYFDADDNTAAGETNLLFNATFTGSRNVGLGHSVMRNLTNGDDNVATGDSALFSDTTGFDNVAAGSNALLSNTTGDDNVATGVSALQSNVNGNRNVAISTSALAANTNGNSNVAVGRSALVANTTGNINTAIGVNAGRNLTTGGRNIDIANPGVAGESGTIRIGSAANQTRTFLAGVWNKTIGGPTKAVVVNSSGRLGTAPKPAAPLRGASGKLSQLRAENRRQSAKLREQAGALRDMRTSIERLRQQVQNGG